MNAPDIAKLQDHLAFAAVAPTTLRGMLPTGARRLLCVELGKLPLDTLNPAGFSDLLDRWTGDISGRVNAPWGPVRKGLNLFLRDAAYNYWTRSAFDLERVEPLLEVPLDGIVMAKIRHQESGNLQRVPVKWLSAPISKQYQNAAQAMATRKGVLRVHLDLELWNGGRADFSNE